MRPGIPSRERHLIWERMTTMALVLWKFCPHLLLRIAPTHLEWGSLLLPLPPLHMARGRHVARGSLLLIPLLIPLSIPVMMMMVMAGILPTCLWFGLVERLTVTSVPWIQRIYHLILRLTAPSASLDTVDVPIDRLTAPSADELLDDASSATKSMLPFA